ncbi:MAG TPA: transposase [Candidatus Acidoferrales bacterium]|nr:transposase [Candidatus Acidoferrales bacterium]
MDGRRIAQQEVDVVSLSTKPHEGTTHVRSRAVPNLAKKNKVGKNLSSELPTKHDVHRQVLDNTVACCVKVKVPDSFAFALETIEPLARLCVDRMLAHRDLSSSRYYPELPCVISKSLIAKYQRNKKCRTVQSPVLPICGDKGRQIKLEGNGMRIPALFKKQILPVRFLRPVVGWIRSVEFLRRQGKWYAAICYNTPVEKAFQPTGTVRVDRNAVGAVATLADSQNGKVLHLGYNPAPTKEVWRRRKANLQSLGKKRLLHKVRNKQSRRAKHENHIVSKQIVDYAAKHRRCIVLEKLEKVRRGKMGRYAEKSQWSFSQLFQFILYKAALRGVMVIEADPAYTSRECSRCHQFSKPNGKSFRGARCGHHDHRDANAAFSLAGRVMPIGGVATESESRGRGLLVAPFPGTEAQQCA